MFGHAYKTLFPALRAAAKLGDRRFSRTHRRRADGVGLALANPLRIMDRQPLHLTRARRKGLRSIELEPAQPATSSVTRRSRSISKWKPG
jgi:hypothetical protein